MSISKINVPNIGEETLEVTEILVKIGDAININQPLIIIEGDKSSMEIPSTHTGIITKIHTNIGDKVHTNSLILSIDTNNNNNANIKSTCNLQTPPQDYLDKLNTPQDHNTIEYNHKNYKKLENIIEFDSIDQTIHATPLIRHMARTLEVDLSKITGSGRKGRILKEDIQNYLNSKSIEYSNNYKPLTSTDNSYIQTDSTIDTNYNNILNNVKTIQLSKIQKVSGINLQKNWSTIPHVTQFDSVDITNLEIFRKQQNLEITQKKINCKITILIFVMKAVAKALEELPRFNSILSKNKNELILKKHINIGIAVDTKQGLLVPVIRDVNKKGIIKLSQELLEISKKARSDNNQLTPLDTQEGSFTISNLGGIGGEMFTPIINAPEVAILGLSKSSMRPIWNGNKFIPRLMLPLSLSYDHRVIDGADGARFINKINKIISDIRLLSM